MHQQTVLPTSWGATSKASAVEGLLKARKERVAEKRMRKQWKKLSVRQHTDRSCRQAKDCSLCTFCLTSGMGTHRPGFPYNKGPTSFFEKLSPDHFICHSDSLRALQMNLSTCGEESTCKPREAGFHCGWDFQGSANLSCWEAASWARAQQMKPGWKRLEANACLWLSGTPGPQGCLLLPALRRKHMGWSTRKNTPGKTAWEIKATLGTVPCWVYPCMTE